MRRGFLACVLIGGVANAQPADPEVVVKLAPPSIDVSRAKALVPPPIPAFELPPRHPSGASTVKEVRVMRDRYMDTEVTIRGFITWRYDCIADVKLPGEPPAATQKRIDQDPTLCQRPEFFIGDTVKTSPEQSIWVVDVPRAYNKLELQRIKKQDRTDPDKCEPNERDPKKLICPPYAVGDEVEVTGMWRRSSAHSERNSDGLVVYGRMKNLTKTWSTPASPGTPAPVASRATTWTEEPLPAIANPPAVKAKASRLAESQKYAAEGTKALVAKQLEAARSAFLRATIALPANHVAYHGLALVHAARREWTDAVAAARQAQALAPNAASYREMLGRALYEKAIADAKMDLARKLGRIPDAGEVDLSALDWKPALLELRHAVALEPAAWRAHYLIGAIHRNAGRAALAAISLTRAIELATPEMAPWIALAELYRRWDYFDQALAVALLGTSTVAAEGQPWLWHEVGVIYEDKQLGDQAIDALTKALDAKSDLHEARFMRGQVRFRLGKLAEAKVDLELFARAADASYELYKREAARMLMDIAANNATGKPRAP